MAGKKGEEMPRSRPIPPHKPTRISNGNIVKYSVSSLICLCVLLSLSLSVWLSVCLVVVGRKYRRDSHTRDRQGTPDPSSTVSLLYNSRFFFCFSYGFDCVRDSRGERRKSGSDSDCESRAGPHRFGVGPDIYTGMYSDEFRGERVE